MAVEVDFITLGDASEKLSTPENRVPPATLRHWTDQLEEFGVHFVQRNNRNERIYYDTDLEVFKFIRDQRKEHGRKTTSKDLAYFIAEKAEKDGMFELRKREDVPIIEPTINAVELLNQEDIKKLMESDRVKQFVGVVVAETTKNLRNQLIEEVRAEVKAEMEESNRKTQESLDKIEEGQKKRDENLMSLIKDMMDKKKEENKGWLSKLIGK